MLIDEYVGDRRIALSPDGRLIACPTPAGGVKVFDVRKRSEVVKEIPAAKLAGGLATEVTALAFNPDASVLAIGTDTGPILIRRPVHREVVDDSSQEKASSSLEWSHDGRLLASGRSDGRTQFFDREGRRSGCSSGRTHPRSTTCRSPRTARDSRQRVSTARARYGPSTERARSARRCAIARRASRRPRGSTSSASSPPATDGSVVFRDATGAPDLRTRVRGEALTVAVDTKRRRVVVGGTDGVTSFGLDGERRAASRPRPWMGAERRRRSDHGPRRSRQWTTHAVSSTPRSKTPGTYGSGIRPQAEEIGRASGTENDGVPIAVAWAPEGSRLAVSTDSNFLTLHDGKTHRREGGSDRAGGLEHPGDRVLARRDADHRRHVDRAPSGNGRSVRIARSVRPSPDTQPRWPASPTAGTARCSLRRRPAPRGRACGMPIPAHRSATSSSPEACPTPSARTPSSSSSRAARRSRPTAHTS